MRYTLAFLVLGSHINESGFRCLDFSAFGKKIYLLHKREFRMTEITQDQANKKARDLFNKGFVAFERGNLDYAIDLLSACIQIEPAFLQARRFLRAAEIQRFKQTKLGAVSKAMLLLKALPKYGQALALVKSGKADQALWMAEELLKDDPLNRKYLRLAARAAEQAGLPEAAIQTLEVAYEHYPDDAELVEWLGQLYRQAGRTREARQMFEKLCELKPRDLQAMKQLKDVTALDSMLSDGWVETAQKGGTYRGIIKDTKEAVLLEQEAKAVKSDKDAAALIAEFKERIAAEPGNANLYRGLARLYAQRKMFDEAIETLTKALEMNPGDPELDAAVSQMRIQKYDYEIEQLKQAGDTAGAAAKEAERNQFYADNLQERVRRYPNDLKLRYEWGVLLYENDMLNEAIQQFQLSQRSPKHRIRSLYYLGMCFKQKKQYDLAVEQFLKADSEIAGMDADKKEILYELGRTYELMGRPKDAVEAYKRIYQVDIGFKDVAQRVESLYK